MRRYKIRNRIFLIINTVIPLLVGGVLYYLFCPNVYFVKMIDSVLGDGIHFSYTSNIWWKFARNYLFDFFWAYSFTSAISAIVNNKVFRFVVSIIFICTLEILQKFFTQLGTFDFIDLIVEICAIFIVWLELTVRGKANEKT